MITKNKLIIVLAFSVFACKPAVEPGDKTSISFVQHEIDMGKLEYKMPETVEKFGYAALRV